MDPDTAANLESVDGLYKGPPKYSPLVSLLAFTTANFTSSEVRVAYTLYNSPQASASASSEIEMLLQPTIPPVFVMRPT